MYLKLFELWAPCLRSAQKQHDSHDFSGRCSGQYCRQKHPRPDQIILPVRQVKPHLWVSITRMGLSIVFIFFIATKTASCGEDAPLTKDDISEERQNHLQQEIQSFLSNNGSFTSLPIHSKSKRPSISCPGVDEEEIFYK